MSFSEPNASTKKIKYILVTHGDSYLGHILAIHLAEEIFKHDRKEHWFVRVLCKEGTMFRREFEKRGINVKVELIIRYMSFVMLT
jgi:hypothetical protein